MQIEQLEYLIEVAKSGSFTNAAHNLNVSHSTVSKSISSFEKELGVKIFNRSRLGTEITFEGKKIIKKVYETLNKLQEIVEVAQSNSVMMPRELKISAVPSFLMTILFQSISAFQKKYPDVKIELTEKASHEIIDDIKQNKIDLGFIGYYENKMKSNEGLIIEKLMEGKMYVLVSKHSPLAFSETVTPLELLDYPVAMYNGENIQLFIKEFLNKHGDMRILFTSNHIEVIKKAVCEGLAISFFTDKVLIKDPYVLSGEIVPIPLVNHDMLNLSYGWVCSKKSPHSHVAREFLRHLKL